LAAFIPLGFWPGIMGEFMKYFPITLIIVLTSSLFVALVINPVIALKYMKIDEEVTDSAEIKIKRKKLLKLIGILAVIGMLAYVGGVMWLGNLMVIAAVISILNYFVLRPASFSFQQNFLPWLENFYDNFVRFSLKHPFLTVVINFVFLIISVMLFAIVKPKVDFFPTSDPLYVNAFIELPMGTDIEATNRIVKDIESRIDKKLEGKRHIVEAVSDSDWRKYL
jgi:multidrug efflux pump